MDQNEHVDQSSLPITVLPDLEHLLPNLEAEETKSLREDIENNGVRDALIVWRTLDNDGRECRVLVDGHNRRRISLELGRDVDSLPVREMSFTDLEEVKTWIIANQLMRRNMTDAQRSCFRAQLYEAIKSSRGGDRKSKCQVDSLIGDNQNAANKVATQFGVSPSTIMRDVAAKKQIDALPPEEKAAVLSGKKRLPRTQPPRPAPKPVDEFPDDEAEDQGEMSSKDFDAIIASVRRHFEEARKTVLGKLSAISPEEAERILASCGMNEFKAAVEALVQIEVANQDPLDDFEAVDAPADIDDFAEADTSPAPEVSIEDGQWTGSAIQVGW